MLTRDHVYVKVICTLKFLEEQAVFIVDHIEEVKDFNLITNHILCSIHALLSVDNDVKLDGPEVAATVDMMVTHSAMKQEFDHLTGQEKVKTSDQVHCDAEGCHRGVQKGANIAG